MKNMTGSVRVMAAVLVGTLVLAGCGWTNEEKPPPSQRLEDSIRIYGLARANGEAAQAELQGGTRSFGAIPLIIRSQRLATHLSDGEELEGQAAGLAGSLRDLTLEWTSFNNQALRASRSGDKEALRHRLERADKIEARIDSLLAETDFENLGEASISNRYAHELLNRIANVD